MKQICFYFQVHQPYRVSKYTVFDLESEKQFFEGPERVTNKAVFEKVAHKCYLPSNMLLLELIKLHPEFKISFSITGTFLEQCMEYGEIGKKVLKSFKDLADTGNVEFLAETYYHSFAALFSRPEFARQVKKHTNLINKLFGLKPKVFRNTELVYNNDIAYLANKLGFKGVLLEGWDPVLQGKSPNLTYRPPKYVVPNEKFGLLLKNYKLSDDIAFRFSNKHWSEHPLTVEKFVNFVYNNYGDHINLFMDFETFGEHQWEDTGIFEFMRHLPDACLKNHIKFRTPSESLNDLEHAEELDVPHHISWADMERDMSAWLENSMQQSSMNHIFSMEKKVMQTRDNKLKDIWRKLQTSDHFYYMSTKYWSDGDVHKYFSPFETPYDAYISYRNILAKFEDLIENKINKKCQDR
ncbi:polysaccharide deacetylase family protein [Candidatus Peregrinibacteria bacterium]|nr:polysaccharide deacetylase family protein [Candidatus Peregrinibacteria bacterium]